MIFGFCSKLFYLAWEFEGFTKYKWILAWELEGINWFLARSFEGWEETKNYAGNNCKIDGDETNFKADEGFKWGKGGTEDGD